MQDDRIVELYWERDEKAISETHKKYGRYCYSIAYNILHNHEDAEECQSDTYLEAWNQIPPARPNPLSGFLGMLTRRNSIDRVRRRNAQKRREGEFAISLEELEDCIPGTKSIAEEAETQALAQAISTFLAELSDVERDLFLRRYWYFDPIKSICKRYGFKESKVKMTLLRTRAKLSEYLEKEGFFV